MGHTPGPWRANGWLQVLDDKAGLGDAAIAVIYEDVRRGRLKHEAEANARLIAASPAMYEYIERRANEGDVEAQRIVERVAGQQVKEDGK